MSNSSSTPSATSYYADSVSTPPSSIAPTAAPSFVDLNKALEQSISQGLDLQKIRDELVNVAYDAGNMMKNADPSVDSSCEKKNSSDRVTATDKAIEAMVKERLTTAYPQIDFLGEETYKEGEKLTDHATFVCDPIDGTLNFIHGFPNVAISLALTVLKEPVVGVVYNPFRGDLFTAIKSRGAFLTRANGHTYSLPLKPNAEPINGLNDCLVAVEWGSERHGPNWDLRLHMHKSLLSSEQAGGVMCHSIRSNGSAALDFCYVAAGWFDVFWEGGCWIWDICAGWLLVQEAGGFVAGANPGEWNPTLEGRSYLAVRGAASGQKEVVEDIWKLMGDRKFVFKK